jgi:hypothetical protein
MIDALEPWQPASLEYLQSFVSGRYDNHSHHWFLLPQSKILIERNGFDLVIGSAGCDLIDFCFRKGMSGVWAFYPIEEEYALLASNLKELEAGWLDGSIAV